MKLDQLLGSLTIDQLQDLSAIWAPEERISNSKLALFRVLRERMTRPDRAQHCLDIADAPGRGIVRKLLRSEKVSQSVAVLAASSLARPKSIQETREVVSDLAAMGLVCVEPEKRWETYGSARVSIPDELVDSLRQATGIDGRFWQEILSLADYLPALPEKELTRRLNQIGVPCDEQTPVETVVSQLADSECCRKRLAALSSPLRELTLSAVRGCAGIVPVERLAEQGVELLEVNEPVLARWRNELEANLIGTIGDVSLLDYGIDLDGKVLAVFAEVVEALLSAPSGDAVKLPDPVGPDFLLDLSELISSVRESGAKLKASGALTAAASDRIIANLNRRELPLIGAYDLLELRLVCAEKLGLIARAGSALEVRRTAWEWERRSYEEKAADLFGLIGFAVPTPRSRHHHDGLCEIARSALRSMKPGEWRGGGSLANITLRRYLATLESSDLRAKISDAVHQVEHYVLPPFPGLRQLGAEVREAVVMEAYAMGILDLMVERGRVVAERLGEFGAVAAGAEPTQQAAGKLIATPDFEVIILPEGDTTRLRYEAGQFARREKFEQTYHLRITRERVEEAVVRGLAAEEMSRVLVEHSDTGTVPQNVEYSIRGWAERVRVATAEHVVVLELPDEKLLNVVAELPAMKGLIVRRISPTALALREWPSDRGLLANLRRLGVYVR